MKKRTGIKLFAVALAVALFVVAALSGCSTRTTPVSETATKGENSEVTDIVPAEETLDVPETATDSTFDSEPAPTPTPVPTPTPTPEPTTALVLGKEYSLDIGSIDISSASSENLTEILEALPQFKALTEVELMAADGTSRFTLEDVKALQEALPGCLVHYSFDFFGQTLSTADESVVYDDVDMGEDSVEQIRRVLDVMQNCTYFQLSDCGICSETMAQLRDDYPETEIVWRVYFNEYCHCLTNEETIRAIFKLNDKNCQELKYCTKVKYMDIGHDTELYDVSFISYMPDLEILILSGSPFSDTSVFANCPNLYFLELVWCGNVADLSSLANCKNLHYLNICYSQVKDLTPLDELPLERFMYYVPKVDSEQQNDFIEKHPDCWTNFSGENPYVLGWRYNDQGYTWCDMYLRVREVFDYENNFYNKS